MTNASFQPSAMNSSLNRSKLKYCLYSIMENNQVFPPLYGFDYERVLFIVMNRNHTSVHNVMAS